MIRTFPTRETDQFTAVGTFSDNSTENLTDQVTWASTATSMATVSNTSGSQGLATSVGQGPTTIIATLDGVYGSTVLTVTPAVLQSLAVTPVNPFAVIGDPGQLTAIGTFSDNTTQNLTPGEVELGIEATNSVATVSDVSGSQGVVTGVQKGTSTISATLDGVTGKVLLSVTPVLKSLAVTPAAPTVPKGESEGFTATGTFADNSTENLTNDVTWSSANTAIAAISNVTGSSGLASALATGTSSISASFEGVTGSMILTVSPAVLTSISVSAKLTRASLRKRDRSVHRRGNLLGQFNSGSDAPCSLVVDCFVGGNDLFGRPGKRDCAGGIQDQRRLPGDHRLDCAGGQPTARHIDQRRSDCQKA